ncbi:MAG: hypothetical protein K2Q03_05695 [Sphingobacteriaceae bacterium]|nr:hypothetical protein [Sphingobacteriaceae bacterium]
MLKREEFTDVATLGRLFVDDVFFAYTCEDKLRDLKADGSGKVFAKTAIPAGKYEVIVTKSNRFKRELPLLKSVPFFEGIRIHGGNTQIDCEGCILIGAHSDMKTKIWECAKKVNEFTAKIKEATKNKKVEIVITEHRSQNELV